jgi:hypothetical protein
MQGEDGFTLALEYDHRWALLLNKVPPSTASRSQGSSNCAAMLIKRPPGSLTKGLIKTWMGDATPQRGGRAKRMIRVTPKGVEAAKAFYDAVRRVRPLRGKDQMGFESFEDQLAVSLGRGSAPVASAVRLAQLVHPTRLRFVSENLQKLGCRAADQL